MPRFAVRPQLADLALALLSAAAPFALFHRALGLYWHSDDFFNLAFSRHHTAWQILTSTETWRELPFKLVTPLMFHSFQLDLALAGASTQAFYFHQLLALSACAAALYLVLRLWLPRVPSFVGALLFLLGAPTGGLAVTLMVRHYPEAIALGVVSLGLYVLSVRRQRLALSLASAFFYAVACLAKEIAVPLPFGLLLLPERDLRTRLSRAAPHFVVLGLYFPYRHHLLSTFVGGYGWAIERKDWLRLALELPVKMAREMAGGGLGYVLFSVALGLAVLAPRTWRSALRWFAGLALLFLPVLPVSTEMKSRLAAAPWTLVAVAAACGLARVIEAFRSWKEEQEGKKRGLRAGLGIAVSLAALGMTAAFGVTWKDTLAKAERTSAENRAYLHLGAGDLLFRPSGYPASMGELRAFRSSLRQGTPPAVWAYDELGICRGLRPVRIWEHDTAQERVVDRTRERSTICSAWRQRLRPRVPLSASFRTSGEHLTWQLGPYREGRYALLFGDASGLIAVPPVGGYQSPPRRLEFQLRYESPEGWVTYSPPLVWDAALRPAFTWSRKAALRRGPGRRGEPSALPGPQVGPARDGSAPP